MSYKILNQGLKRFLAHHVLLKRFNKIIDKVNCDIVLNLLLKEEESVLSVEVINYINKSFTNEYKHVLYHYLKKHVD